MNDIIRVREILSDEEAERLWTDTSKLIDDFGIGGAEIILRAQLRFVKDVEEALKSEGVFYVN